MKTKCPHCQTPFKAPDEYKNRNVKCPTCKQPFIVTEHVGLKKETSAEPVLDPGKHHQETYLDVAEKIAYAIGGFFLLMLVLSPFFNWMNIFAGGIAGIKGDGRIVLVLSLTLAIAACLSLVFKKKLFATSLTLQSWGTIACLWMMGMLWKVGNLWDIENMEENPFMGMFGTQVTAGAGLYIGLIGGFGMAVAFGFFAIHFQQRKGTNKKLHRPFVVTQSASIVVGIGIAILSSVVPGPQKDSNLPLEYNTPGSSEATESNVTEIFAKYQAEREERENQKREEELKHKEAEEIRRRTYVKSHPELTEHIREAILKGQYATGMTKEQLAASFGEPDEIKKGQIYEQVIYKKYSNGTFYFENGILVDH